MTEELLFLLFSTFSPQSKHVHLQLQAWEWK